MGQFSFFDADKRLMAISAKGDPLEMIDRVVPFESFRTEIEAAVRTPANEKKSNAGRKPIDVIVMFRMLVLQSLYNLSDEQVEYQVRDRLSFTRFLRLGFEDGVPDGTTLWLFRETLAKAGVINTMLPSPDSWPGSELPNMLRSPKNCCEPSPSAPAATSRRLPAAYGRLGIIRQ
jgi:transposase, IS5 family